MFEEKKKAVTETLREKQRECPTHQRTSGKGKLVSILSMKKERSFSTKKRESQSGRKTKPWGAELDCKLQRERDENASKSNRDPVEEIRTPEALQGPE